MVLGHTLWSSNIDWQLDYFTDFEDHPKWIRRMTEPTHFVFDYIISSRGKTKPTGGPA